VTTPKYHHKRKIGIFWGRFIKILTRKLIAILAVGFFLFYFGVAYAQAPVHALINQITKPKPISQSSKNLPPDVQQAFQNQAAQDIKQEQANALLTISTINTSQTPQENTVFQNISQTIQEITTTNPSVRAKIKIKRIDSLIAQLQNLLATDKSDKAIDRAVGIIAQIGDQANQVATDPKVQTDREVLALQIEQYNRLQLVLQKIEDQLPITGYVKIDDAREKYLVSGAIASLNAAPNLDAVHNIALKVVASIVGPDFAELKAIEILTDIKSGLKPQAQQKVTVLEKQLAVQFEKRMLSLPPTVRTRKLQQFINFSYGNPVNQVKSFYAMQDFLHDRDVILSIESLETLSLKQLENRVFAIHDPQTNAAFLKLSLKTPEDLKVFAQMQLDIAASGDQKKIDQFAKQIAASQNTVVDMFGSNTQLDSYFGDATNNADLLDVSVTSQLSDILHNSAKVSPEVKQKIAGIKQKKIQGFVANIAKNGFLTQSKPGYNPVPDNADVRILLPAPAALGLLEKLIHEVSSQDASKIVLAEKANTRITANHLLLQVNDPQTFKQYSQFIVNTPHIKQLVAQNVGNNFFTLLAQKKQIIDKQSAIDDQQLYEKMQQLVQSVFVSKDKTNLEQILPTNIQQEIAALKTELPDRNVPKLDTPSDVTLPSVASLPQDVQNALIASAKDKIATDANKNPINIATEAKDLGVSVPVILPGNPLYPIVEVGRKIELALHSDPISRAETLIKQDNEKTLEAAVLIEENKSTKNVATAITTLQSVASDFDLLSKKAAENKNSTQNESAKVTELVDEIINTGITRQTILSQIENKLHGNDFVAVESIRADELKDGTNTLLSLTNNNVPQLTNKLESAVDRGSNTVVNDIKAVELLNEIARTQPESVQTVLQNSEVTIAKKLDSSLSVLTPQQKTETLITYAENTTGNPVRQFEALEIVKDVMTNPKNIILVSHMEDKTAQNLEERISEIPDANSEKQFTNTVIGGEPQDLKIVTEIADRIAPPKNAGIVEELPIVQKVEDIQVITEQNIVDSYKDKPEQLQNADFFDNPTLTKTPDVVDIQVAQDINAVLSQTPNVAPAVVAVAKAEEEKIIDTFVTNVSSPKFTVSTQTSASAETNTQTPASANISVLAAQTVSSVPDTLQILIDLKSEASPVEQAKINTAITAEVAIIQNTLVSQTSNAATIQTYVSQIQNNPEVAQVVAQVGGQSLQQTIIQAEQTAAVQTAADQIQLQTTVSQLQQEVFSQSNSNPSPAQQTLPQPIQQEIQQIKQEVPKEQIPTINVATETTVSTTVTAQPVDTTPIAPPVQNAPAPVQESAPAPQAPAAPSAPAPATESKPAEQPAAPEAPAAPAAPGL